VRKSLSSRILLFLFSIVGLFLVNELLVGYFGVMVRNNGVSFGINIGGTLFNVVILLVLGWWVIWKGEMELLLVLAGGGLNLIDRMRFGYVRDYWNLIFGLYNNLADWIIVLGIGVFIINLWIKRSK
jgi:lipoprotein signal peptidase